MQGLELSEVLAKSGASLPRYGDCPAASAAVGQLTAQLEQTKGPVSALLCEADGFQHLDSLLRQLKASARPYLIAYAGKPEQVSFQAPPIPHGI